MKVAIDAGSIKTGGVERGVGFYTRNLLVALAGEMGKGEFKDVKVVEKEEGGNYDLLHIPYFEPYFLTLPLVGRVPTVVTIHDTTRLIYPEHYPPGVRGRVKLVIQKLALRQVAGVVTDSECSRKDIVRFLGVPQEKIDVVRLAAAEHFRELSDKKKLNEVRRKYDLPKEFVLYVGDIDWNKNVVRLAEAVKKTKLALVIAGKQAVNENYDRFHPEMQPLRRLQEKYGKDKQIRRLGFVPDEELVAIYNLATLYCHPSFYEGFGLTVLEAMACGCPVVCSRRASLVEIGDKAVEWIEPDKVGEMAETIEKVAGSVKLRRELARKGKVWVRQFSWKKVAREMLAIYRKYGN